MEEEKKVVEEKKVPPVDYVVHESILARMERAHRRMWILCLVLVALFIGSWVGFFIYESQFEDVSVSQDIDTGEGDAVLAGVGDVHYGEDSTKN